MRPDFRLGRAMFSDVDPNPNEKNAQAGVKAYNEGGHDGVVAFGGGSGLDAFAHCVGAGDLVSRPVGWAEAGIYATPTAHGMRIAGTVEINAIDAAFNANCTTYLKRKSTEMSGDLGTPDDTWLGHRPTMPDSLPVIGHQHIGLTLGGVAGKIITDLALKRTPDCNINDFDPQNQE